LLAAGGEEHGENKEKRNRELFHFCSFSLDNKKINRRSVFDKTNPSIESQVDSKECE
jgi:hypothetical protein